MNTHALIIDPQVDFCQSDGALFVPGADEDMQRLAAFLRREGAQIDALHVTLDTHHFVHIAHPVWWRNRNGEAPAPFTIVTLSDIDGGRWSAADPAQQNYSRAYVAALEENGRYPLCLWPPHCLIGSTGHAIHQALSPALWEWEAAHRPIDFVSKGENPRTEHYSALRADVPDPADPRTQLNRRLIDSLKSTDRVLVAGEAGSHCVAHTVRDLVEVAPELAPRLVLLTDAISPVPRFEALQAQFLADLVARGMRQTTTEACLR